MSVYLQCLIFFQNGVQYIGIVRIKLHSVRKINVLVIVFLFDFEFKYLLGWSWILLMVMALNF